MIRVEHIPAIGDSARRVALIVLDRPEKRNALTPDMLTNIAQSAELVRTGEGHADAVVLLGEGAGFCAGFDLSLCRDDAAMMSALLSKLSIAIRALRRLSMPVVVAAHGSAIAGGCALLSGGDIVVTHRDAKLGYPVVRLGVSPAVNAFGLSNSVHGAALRRLLLDPELLSGEEAVRIGLAHELIDTAEGVRDRAIAIASALAIKPAHGMHATKRWLNEIEGADQDAPFEDGLRVSLALAGGAEERERLAALWRKG